MSKQRKSTSKAPAKGNPAPKPKADGKAKRPPSPEAAPPHGPDMAALAEELNEAIRASMKPQVVFDPPGRTYWDEPKGCVRGPEEDDESFAQRLRASAETEEEMAILNKHNATTVETRTDAELTLQKLEAKGHGPTIQRLLMEKRFEEADRRREEDKQEQQARRRRLEDVKAKAAESPIAPNSWRRSGDVWEIWYAEGESFHIYRSDLGMRLLAILLQTPGRRWTHADLYKAANPTGESPIALRTDQLEYGGDGEAQGGLPDGYTVTRDSGQTITTKDRDKLRQYVDNLKGEMAGNTDPQKKVELGEEIGKAEKYLSSSLNRWGNPRELGSIADKDRRKIGQAIDRAIERIKGFSPELGEHLTREMKVSGYTYYCPDPPIEWDVHF